MAKTKPLRGDGLANLMSSQLAKVSLSQRPAPHAGEESSVHDIDPSKVKLNAHHRRSSASMSGKALQDMIATLEANGQQLPALGYRLPEPDADGKEVVLIYGARRWAACAALGRALKIKLLDAPPGDEKLIRLMHTENRARLDYQPLEDAREYQAYLDAGAFASASQMSSALGVDNSKVSRLLQLLKLPEQILDLYSDPAWLGLVNGAKLFQGINKDPVTRKRVMAEAAAIAKAGEGTDPTPRLMRALSPPPKPKPLDEALKDAVKGRVVGKISGALDDSGPLVVRLDKGASMEAKAALAEALKPFFPGFKG